MGSGLGILCKTCKVRCYLGYGSGRMWVGSWKTTPAEYDAEVERWKKMEPDSKGNPHIRAFLEKHDGHEIVYSGEYDTIKDGNLVFEDPFSGEDSVQAEGYDAYQKIERESLIP